MPPAAPAPVRATPFERACLVAAGVLPWVWFAVFHPARPDYLVDEGGHLGNVYHLLEGKPGWPEQMTMLPGYHLVVAALWQLHPPGSLLGLARFVSTVAGCVALGAFAVAWRRLNRPAPGTPLAVAGPATLAVALLPLFQPFTALAYTDVPALAGVLVAITLHVCGHPAAAALAFVPAVLTRQTNLVWPAFLIAYEYGLAATPATSWLRRTRWLLALLAIAVVGLVVAWFSVGRLTPGTQTGNDLHPNPATLHFASLLVLTLGWPAWLAAAPGGLATFCALPRPRRLGMLVSAGLAAALLAVFFHNGHPWNRDLFWEGCTFTLLRNWPLVGLERYPALGLLSGAAVVVMSVALIRVAAGQAHRKALWLALAAGSLLPLANRLVEPRYWLPGIVVWWLFFDAGVATTRRLIGWWALVSAVHAPFIARGLSLW